MNKLSVIIVLTKIITSFLRFFGIGHGTTWPGEIALNLDKHFISHIIKKNKQLKTVVVAGTNGKTTSVKSIKYILSQNGKKVFSNQSGANLLNGVTSTLIKHADINGKIDYDIAILEIDENVLPLIINEFHPNAILILNLFRDQLDRYGEINITINKWRDALNKLDDKTSLILNNHDSEIYNLGKQLKKSPVYYFGVSKKYLTKKTIPHEADSIYCPICSTKLKFHEIAYSHIGKFYCPKCSFSNNEYSDLTEDVEIPLLGLFNRYNFSGVALLVNKVFGLNKDQIVQYFSTYKPGFGRQELINFRNKNVLLQLSKNPVGFNQSIEFLNDVKGKKTVLLALNDRIPDGRDISWIWDVDFEHLVEITEKIFVTGDRAYDLGVRLEYAMGSKKIVINNDKITIGSNIYIYKKTSDAILAAAESINKKDTLYVFPVYSAMLIIRKILTGDEFNKNEK
jgi:UDP-N-acetylmuramyl tripeptide synthase